MSRICFHTEARTVVVRGRERARLGALTDKLGLALTDAYLLRRAAPWLDISICGRSVASYELDVRLEHDARLALRYGAMGPILAYQGHPLDPLVLGLNTAALLGSDPVRLAARIHAQCEIHGWVDGPDRKWIADVLEDGLLIGIFRHGLGENATGWTDVLELLREDDGGPVVMSYSGSNTFPNAQTSTFLPLWPEGAPERWDALSEADQKLRSETAEVWDELPAADQWRMSVAYLRTGTGLLQLTPDDWDGYHFGFNGLTWLDIDAGETRFREVLELP